MQIYADNAATTKMAAPVIDVMTECMSKVYGNPSSLHSTGQQAAEVLAQARENVARILGAEPKEITFTSDPFRRAVGKEERKDASDLHGV